MLGVIGVGLIGTAAMLIARVSSFGAVVFVDPQLLILIFVFAGIGSITSILTRLPAIDLRHETSSFLVLVSGASRPIVAIFFATVVYLDSGVFGLQISRSAEGKADEVYLVLAFISGFSERFAQDTISRVGLSSGQPTAGRDSAGPG